MNNTITKWYANYQIKRFWKVLTHNLEIFIKSFIVLLLKILKFLMNNL